LHFSVVRTSPPETAGGRTTPFCRNLRVMEVRVPLGVPSLVLNCVTTVKGLVVSTVPPGP
jgi:hypothetical protein